MSISVRNLTRRFGRFTAVDDATFEVPAGRVAGFLGPNGAGKTTTLKILCGLLPPHAGEARVAGLDSRKDRERMLASTGCLIEQPGFFEHLTALENLLCLGTVGRSIPSNRVKPRALETLEQLGLAQHADRPAGGFSTGMRMRLALAVALLHRPKVLLLDEPTAGLDPLGRRAVRDLIVGANRSDGATVFISSHLLEELETFCDWLVVIESGRVLAQGPLQELLPSTGETRFALRMEPVAEALSALGGMRGVSEAGREGAEITFRARREEVPEIVSALLSRKPLRLYELRDLGRSLEEFYFQLTRTKPCPPCASS